MSSLNFFNTFINSSIPMNITVCYTIKLCLDFCSPFHTYTPLYKQYQAIQTTGTMAISQ